VHVAWNVSSVTLGCCDSLMATWEVSQHGASRRRRSCVVRVLGKIGGLMLRAGVCGATRCSLSRGQARRDGYGGGLAMAGRCAVLRRVYRLLLPPHACLCVCAQCVNAFVYQHACKWQTPADSHTRLHTCIPMNMPSQHTMHMHAFARI
jgi:hypothetical protein